MSERFIKYIPSEKSAWLRKHYPSVFLLLSLAIEQARWSEDILDGLLPGDAILGNYEDAGLTRKQYRTALDKGIELGYWEVVFNQKDKNLVKSPKRAIKRAIKSIVINITNSSIWDLNIPIKGQDIGQRGANTGPTKGHKQRKIKNVKKEKEEQPQTPSSFKIKFRENVELTQIEFDSLLAKHGQIFLDKMLDALDSYKGSTGKTYESDYYTMKEGGWVIERVNKEMLTPKVANENKTQENETLGKTLVIKYEEYVKGWRCNNSYDNKKNQKGILFESTSAYVEGMFFSFSDSNFKEKVVNFLKSKNL